MENLLDNNFELLANELFDVPRDSGISYFQTSTNKSQFFQQAQHRHHSRSDSLLSDVKGGLNVIGVENSLGEFTNLRDVDISKSSGTNSNVDRNNRMGMDLGSSIDEFSNSNYNINRSAGNHNFRRIDDSFLDIDSRHNSMNNMSLETNSDTCIYQQNNSNNNLINSRVLNSSFTPNMHLNMNRNSSARVSKNSYLEEEHVDFEKSNRFVSTDYRISQAEGQNGNSVLTDSGFHVMNTSQFVSEFDNEQQKHIQGIVGRYNSMCIDDQLLKMGIYSNCINGDNNGNDISNITINTTKNDNTNKNNGDKMFLPSIDHSSVNASNSVLNGAFSHDLGNLDRENSECFRGISSSYIQRRFNSDFGSCNMTNTTVSSEPSSLSGVATPGGSSLNSGNSTDTLTQRFRNSSSLNLNYDILDVSSSNGMNFDKLSSNTIGINGYVKQVNVSSTEDSNIILEDVVSEMNSNVKLRFARNNSTYNGTGISIGACNHRIFGNNVMNNINNGVVNNHAHDNHHNHNGVSSTNNNSNSNNIANNNNSNVYSIKKSSKNTLIQSGFPMNGSNTLVIDDDEIYPINHFVSNNANSPQIMNLLSGGNSQIDKVSVNVSSNTNTTSKQSDANNSNINKNGDGNIKNGNPTNHNNHNSNNNSNNGNNNNINGNNSQSNNNQNNNGLNCVNNNFSNNQNNNIQNGSNQSSNNQNNQKGINTSIKDNSGDITNSLNINTISNSDNCNNTLNFIPRTGIENSPLIDGYISPYNECNNIDNKTHLNIKSGEEGHFDIGGTGTSQIHNIFNHLDTNGNYGMDSRTPVIDEMDFGGGGKSFWHQPSFYQYHGSVGNGSSGILDWRSRQIPMFERCKFVDDFGCETLFNSVASNRNQQKQKYFNQQRAYNFQSNINNKQQKQSKQRGEASPNLKNFEINQRIAGSFRNSNIPIVFGEGGNHVLRCGSNANRHNNRSNNKKNSGNIITNISSDMDGLPLNANINIQNIVNNAFINQNQMQYCRKTCPPNCSIQNHIGNNLFKRKSNNSASFNNINTCNSSSRFLGDFGHSNTNISNSNMNTSTYNKKGIDEAHFTNGVKNGRKNPSGHFKLNNNITSSNSTSGNFFSHHYNCASSQGITVKGCHLNSSNTLNGTPCHSKNEISSSEVSQNALTPSSIAALWAKAMSKTGGRTGFNNRNKHHGSNYTQNGNENRENNIVNNGQVDSISDSKNAGNEVITCARFSSFLRNNSGRLHWLRVLYHYLDTVDISKIRGANREGETPCMVAVDDIALEAVSKSFDPSECAYWSEPENGAFVHKNIRLAVAHKVGHRTVVSPQNYVNQILTASLDHSVSILLNTLRAIDDRVRWMSTVVNCKNGTGFQIDIKSNKIGSVEDNQKNTESKDNADSGCNSTNGNTTSITTSSTNTEEFNNETNANTTSSTKNFPGRVFTVGVREAMRCLRHRKLKALIVAPDIEGDGVEGSLRHHVIHILLQAQELNIPTIFALNRHRIGRAMGKHMRMSVLGLLSIRGVERQFQAISHTAQLLRKLYHFCVENNLPPTEETFKKLSSSINNIN